MGLLELPWTVINIQLPNYAILNDVNNRLITY